VKTPRIYGLVAGIVGVTAIALAYAASSPPYPPPPPPKQPRVPLSDDPIDLWMKLMPVIHHPRCANCHGGVNPLTEYTGPPAVEHTMGVFGDPSLDLEFRFKECEDCHNETEEIKNTWVLAHNIKPDRDFFRKPAKQICEEQSLEVVHMKHATSRTWIEHMRDDALIRQSFGGKAGGQLSPADPPPMEHRDFLEAAQKWLDVGAVCGRWKGQIKQKETFSTAYTYPIAGANGTNAVSESATREIIIDRDTPAASGTAATVSMSGIGSVVQTLHFTAPNGPCTSISTSTDNWHSLPLTGTDISVRVLIRDDGSYEIRFSLPKEKTRASTSGVNRNDCGIPFPPSEQEPPIELEWNKWTFTIRCPSPNATCQRFDPRNPVLEGSIEETIVGADDAVERRSWLNVSPVGTSRADDGSPIPVKVKTNWEFELVQ
jgi:hypothetical protein